MKANDIAIDLMAEACDNALLPGDFCIVAEDHYGNGYISYSRYCKGGAYIPALLYAVYEDNLLVVTPIITGVPEGWKHGEPYEAPLYDPDVINKVRDFVKGVFSKLQLDRSKWWSEDALNTGVQIRYRSKKR